MQPEKEQLSQLLNKYLQGEASHQEVRLLHKWLHSLDVSEQQLFQDASEVEEVGQRMRENINARIRQKSRPVRKLYPVPTWLRAVAASVLLVLGVLAYHQFSGSDFQASAVIVADGDAIKKVTLPDGTVVKLNLHARLEVDEDYNTDDRKVRLFGEAFFDVKQDSLRPFVVMARNTNTYVLGTAFNIESYEEEEQVRVALLRGKVRVQDDEELQSELVPGQVLVYDMETKTGVVQPIATQQIAGWLKNKIIFNDVPLQDAISRIQHLHHLKIQIDPALSLEGKRVTGDYENDEAEEALEAMLFLHHMKMKKKGDTLFIQKY